MNDIEIKVGKELSVEQMLALYDSVGWAAYTNEQNRAKLGTAVQNSTYVVSAWDGDNLVGLARGLSDDVSIFYLQDILVRPEFQGMGIGRELLKNCLERFSHVRTKMLLTDNQEKQLRYHQSLAINNTRHLSNVVMNAFVQLTGVRLE
jgi:ribosomal protein S18 acetylase RimI-like enzyme